ncbi:MAG: regulatory iron-sulfur-containing complex subunit RicT [Patescibacteria group bacterium]
MKIVQIQFAPWDKIYNFDPNNLELEAGDSVVVKTELGTEIGRVVSFKEVDKKYLKAAEKKVESDKPADGVDLVEPGKEEIIKEIKPVLRKATSIDLGKLVKEEEKNKAFSFCRKMIDKQGLPMKLVDVHFAFDGSRVTFAFIADGRIDFRELVKDLTRHFSKSIRLQQIGIRDEAKLMGDFGHCGRKLCCKKFLHNLESITSEMAERQQVVHRGSERISGICGRLMCCLAYEEAGYQELAKKLPLVGTKVNVDGKRGVVVGQHILKQTVNVEFPGEKGEASSVVEIDINRNKH